MTKKWYSHLIATPVVDKNGKLTTVHKKTTPESSVAEVPTVNLRSQDKQSIQSLINALPKWCQEVVSELSELSDGKDREVIGGVAELLITGSEHTQSQVSDAVASRIKNIKSAANPVFLYSQLLKEMTVFWHTSEVAQQAELPPVTTKSYVSSSSRALQYDRRLDSNVVKNDDYWRSLAILAHARIDHDVMDTPMFKDFVDWNKTEPDLKCVINTIAERQSYDPLMLQDLIDQREGKNSSLHDGLL